MNTLRSSTSEGCYLGGILGGDLVCQVCNSATACITKSTIGEDSAGPTKFLCTYCAPHDFGFKCTLIDNYFDGKLQLRLVPMLQCGVAIAASAVHVPAADAVHRHCNTCNWWGVYVETKQHDGLFVAPLPDSFCVFKKQSDGAALPDRDSIHRGYTMPLLKMAQTASWEGATLKTFKKMVLLAAFPAFCASRDTDGGEKRIHVLSVESMTNENGAVQEYTRTILKISDGGFVSIAHSVIDDAELPAATSSRRQEVPRCLPAKDVMSRVAAQA